MCPVGPVASVNPPQLAGSGGSWEAAGSAHHGNDIASICQDDWPFLNSVQGSRVAPCPAHAAAQGAVGSSCARRSFYKDGWRTCSAYLSNLFPRLLQDRLQSTKTSEHTVWHDAAVKDAVIST